MVFIGPIISEHWRWGHRAILPARRGTCTPRLYPARNLFRARNWVPFAIPIGWSKTARKIGDWL